MRKSGVLLHIASLPDKYGVGSLGAETDNFIKFLSRSKQSYWQILPVNPVDYVNSPYASPSGYAGNYLLIDLEKLVESQLITAQDLADIPRSIGMNYEVAKEYKRKILKKAFFNFFSQPNLNELYAFIDDNYYWLEDYALYSALKEARGGASWLCWERALAQREPNAIKKAKEEYEESIDFYRFEQYIFYKQWGEFRSKLAAANIKLIGDMPYYVAVDSVDVWVNQKLFLLDKNGVPKVVAGVAPDYFSKTGQLWGNPIYNYKQMAKDGYAWWRSRLAHNKKLFDVLRIDHFRAFDSYYTVKFGRSDARVGRWNKNNGEKLLDSALQGIAPLKIVAEDLGDIPQSVYALRDKYGMAGMKIMQFGFDGNPNNHFLPDNFTENYMAYLGTHDNQTTAGWYNTLPVKNKKFVCGYLKLSINTDTKVVVDGLLTAMFNSKADTVIVSMQDLNYLDDNYRMNTPGTIGCWNYMETPKDFSMSVAMKLLKLTEESNRDE